MRGYRRPVSGAVLAEALGISLRTLYRDIETLNARGAQIDGEPGFGYVLRRMPGRRLFEISGHDMAVVAMAMGASLSPA